MNHRKTKLYPTFPAFIIIAFLTITAPLLLRYFFSVWFDLVSLKPAIWEFWIPVIWPWIPLTIWLRPKPGIQHFKNSGGNIFFHLFASAAAIIACSMVSQNYVSAVISKSEQHIIRARPSRYVPNRSASIYTSFPEYTFVS